MKESKYLLIGLGNPGERYLNTWHNVGFSLLDFIASNQGLLFQKKKKYAILETCISEKQVIFLKPLQYMNNSGFSVAEISRFFKIKPHNIIVCYDEMAFNLGKFKLKTGGSSGGHNGVQSIIQCLGTQDFIRLRVGIQPEHQTILKDFVLKNIPKASFSILNEKVFPHCFESIQTIIANNIDKAMNLYNG